MCFEGEFLNGKKFNGKQYDEQNRLIFEGEYLNGKKWKGKGTIYYKKNILFQGTYFKGKRWNGSIRTIDCSDKIIFEGNLVNGLISKEGKEYYEGKLIFEGNYLSGLRNGDGIEYDNIHGKKIFEGEYLYGYRKKGKAYVNGVLEFKGEYFFEKKWNGVGFDENQNVIYKLNNGNGKIREYNDATNTLEFEGEYKNGQRDGKGKEFQNGEIIFEGEYKNGQRDGKGKEFEYGLLKFEGEFYGGLRHGKGKQYFGHSLFYEVEYKFGELIEDEKNIIIYLF